MTPTPNKDGEYRTYLCPKCTVPVAYSGDKYECNNCGRTGQLKDCPIFS